jgi:L-lactate dehydrogenase
MQQDYTKISIVGCGKVGMTAAYALTLAGLCDELVLMSRSVDKVIGEQLDLEHGMAYLSPTKIKATQEYDDLAKSDIVVFTAGAHQNPGETRLDLAEKNKALVEEMIPKIVKVAPQAVIVMVTNPVDILTYHAYQLAGLPKGQIFGSGTALDTARFRFHISQFLKVNPRSIHAYILGEHGDSSFAALSSASIGGQPLSTFENFSPEKAEEAYLKAKNAAAQIIAAKGATYYAIGVIITEICKNILRNSQSILPLSIPLHGYYDLHGVALSIPCVLGRTGVTRSLDIKLDWQERQLLAKSASIIRSYTH